MGSLVAEADKTHKAYIRVYMHVIHTYIHTYIHTDVCTYTLDGWMNGRVDKHAHTHTRRHRISVGADVCGQEREHVMHDGLHDDDHYGANENPHAGLCRRFADLCGIPPQDACISLSRRRSRRRTIV